MAEETSIYGGGLFRAAGETNTKTGDEVKAFIFTSSAWAAFSPKAGVERVVTETSWNEEDVAISCDEKLTRPKKGVSPFVASKVRIEKILWDWEETGKPSFRVNAILPNVVIGPLFDGDRQSGGKAGIMRMIYKEENMKAVKAMPPQWFVDARDNARLYVVALAIEEANGWRVFGCGERFSWRMVLDNLKKIDETGKTDWVEMEDRGLDLSDIRCDKGVRLLRFLGQEGWTGLMRV